MPWRKSFRFEDFELLVNVRDSAEVLGTYLGVGVDHLWCIVTIAVVGFPRASGCRFGIARCGPALVDFEQPQTVSTNSFNIRTLLSALRVT